jgi:spore coat polysaccharide biosynthesis protein SpsF
MGSSRLPGKVMRPLAGRPLLERMVERLRAARTHFELCVATTESDTDEPIRALCRRIGVDCMSGHPTDLLDRHVQAARRAQADAVVKIPSDCPLIDPGVVDRVLGVFLESPERYDLVTNLLPGSWPDGNDVEVMPVSVLETADREARRPLEREHTTPFIWERPERFRIANVTWETGLDYSKTHRLTVDYLEDYALVAAIFAILWRPERPLFSLGEIVDLLQRRPDLLGINVRFAGQGWQVTHAAELRSFRAAPGAPRWVPADDTSSESTPESRAESNSL